MERAENGASESNAVWPCDGIFVDILLIHVSAILTP